MVVLPIILFLIIIAAIFWSINRATSNKTFVSEQKVKWIFLFYVGILVVSTIVYMILPKDYYHFEINSEYYEADQTNVGMEHAEEYFSFYEVVANDELDEIEGIYVKEQWDFGYEDDRLTIKSNEYFGATTFVEEKEVDDNKIEVTLYMTNSTVNGIDITDKIKLPKVQLVDNRLHITPPERVEIKFQRFEKEAVIGQFNGKPWYSFDHRMISMTGEQMLYVKVPKNLEIVDDNVYIQYVSELRK